MDYPVLVNPGKPLKGRDEEENQGDSRAKAPHKRRGGAQGCVAAGYGGEKAGFPAEAVARAQ